MLLRTRRRNWWNENSPIEIRDERSLLEQKRNRGSETKLGEDRRWWWWIIDQSRENAAMNAEKKACGLRDEVANTTGMNRFTSNGNNLRCI
jgi:hypothetical protein